MRFNLYGESPGFYLWLRLITREKNYNLYVYFYGKSIAENGTAMTQHDIQWDKLRDRS